VIEIKYLISAGSDANGLSVFTTSDPLFDSVAKPTITPSASTGGGGDKESIESIRANAPLGFLAQNRAVTVDDYKSIIRNNINVSAISVWGGEDNNPPEYGRVFLSIKPQNGLTLSESDKDFLLPILDKKGILTVKPKFVDPEFVYLYFDFFAKYNSNLTNLSEAGVSDLIRRGLAEFNTAYLADFDGVFRYSQFLAFIVNKDPSILSAFARVYAYKKFTAQTLLRDAYKINFNFALEEPEDTTKSLISSTPFLINSTNHYFADEPSTIENIRSIYIYKVDNLSGLNVMTHRNIGTVNVATGEVIINFFDIDINTEIKIFVRPASNDIAPVRNQIIEIDNGGHTLIESEVDTIAISGSIGAIDYNTIAREE
jgi:hypothetical protein